MKKTMLAVVVMFSSTLAFANKPVAHKTETTTKTVETMPADAAHNINKEVTKEVSKTANGVKNEVKKVEKKH